MPLVPEPIDRVSISRQGVFLRGGDMAENACAFFPDLNIPKCREQFGDAEKDTLDKRADALKTHSLQNHFHRASESPWEADVRNDVFGKIRG